MDEVFEISPQELLPGIRPKPTHNLKVTPIFLVLLVKKASPAPDFICFVRFQRNIKQNHVRAKE
jgi:hypothetical protein